MPARTPIGAPASRAQNIGNSAGEAGLLGACSDYSDTLRALDPETRVLPGRPVAAQVDDPLPATVAEGGGRDVGTRAVTTVENELVPGCPGNIVHAGQQLL